MDNDKKNLYIILFVLLLVVIVLIISGISNSNSSNSSSPTKGIVTIIIDDQRVKDAMASYNNLYITENDLYNKEIYKIENISNNDLLKTAIKAYTNSTCLENIETSMTELNNALNQYIQNKQIDFDIINSSDIDIYINDEGNININNNCQEDDNLDDYIAKKVVKASLNDNYMYIYEKQAFARYIPDENDMHMVKYYKTYDKEQEVAEKKPSLEFPYKKNEPNWDLYDIYKYTFKIEGENYYFQSVESVKEIDT